MAMPTIPLHVHNDLGLPVFYVGLVSSSQFIMAFVSRLWGGVYADTKGYDKAAYMGFFFAVISGVLYYTSLLFFSQPFTSITILIIARGILGAGESLVITSACAWAIKRAGIQKTGVVLSWIGAAMFMAYAISAPLGTFLYNFMGFKGISFGTLLFSLSGVLFVLPLNKIDPVSTKQKTKFLPVFKAIVTPGLGLAFSSLGFGAIVTFIALAFSEHGWENVWLAFTLFSLFYIFVRFFFGHIPDKLGGAKVAIVCLIIEAIGQACIWLAPSSTVAFIGASLTGLGYSLVYPCFGVEAIKDCAPNQIAITTGTYTAFIDIALGIAGPTLGIITGFAGIMSVYGLSMLSCLCSMFFAWSLLRSKKE